MAKVDGLLDPDDEDWWDESDEEDEENLEEEEEEWEIEEEDEVELEGGKEEVIEEVVEKEQVGETLLVENKIVEECGKLCLAIVFEGNKTTKEVFTTADMGIVSSAGIAEDVLVKIGSLTVPADCHVIRTTKHSKGGKPQVLLRRPTLKTTGFKLNYITETFSFKVGYVEEIYHPKRPPALNKKFAHQVQLSSEHKVEGKKSKKAKERLKKARG
ncbi:hypothetical protein PIB30_091520 [Stylosanthes scabra]|uniref:Uncharacterized protein n=1 Tax=Stylosanthes scabra TaxID=79078 RepID=A0ABU6SV37_9FABA|nr:hypothetical protein [Stylosanthes scabra]